MSTSGRKSRNPVLAAEAGSRHIKLVEVDRSGRQGSVLKIFLKEIDGGGEFDAGELAGHIRKLKLGNRPVIGCLPRQAVNMRLLEVPSADPAEIADMVELQIGKQTPYSRDEIVADYRFVGSGREGYTRVMLIIVQRSLMNQRFRMLEQAGLELEGMSVSSEGILSWYSQNRDPRDSHETAALLDIDAAYTDFAVVSRGQLVFSKSILIGSEHLAAPEGNWKDKLLQEIEHSIQVFREETGAPEAIGRILITGARGGIEGFDSLLGKRLGLKVELADSMGKLKTLCSLPENANNVSFTALIGMAMAPETLQFNLVPETVMLRRNLETKARGLTLMGIFLNGILSLSAAMSMAAMQQKVQNLTMLSRKHDAIAPQALQVEKWKYTTTMVQERLDSARSPVNVLLELHKVTPLRAVIYDSIALEADTMRLTLKGRARTYADIETLRQNLVASDIIYDNVTLGPQTRTPDGRVRFEILCSATAAGEAGQ